MLKVGITGGIGTGKSTVARIFSALGLPVYEADQRAKSIIEDDSEVVKKIKDLLGKDAYFSNGKYNKTFVAGKVFENQELLKQLNGIVHPAVGEDFENWVNQHQQAQYVIKEAAIMGRNSGLDKIIVVTSPLELRIDRIKKRDGRSADEIKKIITNQKTENDFLHLADFLIENNEVDFIIPQVLTIDSSIKSL